MKRNDWASGREYDPATVNKPWWTEVESGSPEYDKMLKTLMGGKIATTLIDGTEFNCVWEDAGPPQGSKPKLKPK